MKLSKTASNLLEFGHNDQSLGKRLGTHGPNYRSKVKRVLDIGLSIVILPVISPVIAVLWLIMRLEGGSGFFGHSRVGENGAAFKCWKIRSMVPDAQKRLEDYLAANPAAAAQWEENYKLDNDPRITRFGNFLRQTSLDELPQIWNVIKGEMSFVGPRPVTQAELAKYDGFESAYLSTRPGITGLWQVSGRNDVSYDERVGLDMRYLNSMSLVGDLKIIAQTARAVLDRTGC